ncbi:MAG: hypothetical protein KGD66_00455 [Candidatus Lokiarchaeota archaeon]|nr:hypothetical protein [Candidatus Lokiarchaeota archaeon]
MTFIDEAQKRIDDFMSEKSIDYRDILKYIEKTSQEKNIKELISILMDQVEDLCFKKCQLDRVSCVLTPRCSRRFLLNMRLKYGVTNIPDFCYGIQKNNILRDFRNKTVVYRPNDSYLSLIDFFDVFFHGDYRKLNRLIEKHSGIKFIRFLMIEFFTKMKISNITIRKIIWYLIIIIEYMWFILKKSLLCVMQVEKVLKA